MGYQMKRIIKRFVDLSIGDQLPAFTVSETQETINNANMQVEGAAPFPRNIHTDTEFARSGMFAGTVNSGVATMAYVNQMLEQWFPSNCFYNGGRLLFKAIRPIRPGDTITFTGTITAKRIEQDTKIIECGVEGRNQLGALVGVADATLVLDK